VSCFQLEARRWRLARRSPSKPGHLPQIPLEPWKDLYPTTSVRTLYDPDHDRHYKVSFDAQITSHTRLLHRHEAANAVAASNLLVVLNERRLLPGGVFFLPELTWTSHPSSDLANCLVRAGLADMIPKVPRTPTLTQY
jgi:hypothetical protein